MPPFPQLTCASQSLALLLTQLLDVLSLTREPDLWHKEDACLRILWFAHSTIATRQLELAQLQPSLADRLAVVRQSPIAPSMQLQRLVLELASPLPSLVPTMCAEIVATRQRTHVQLLEQTHAQMEMDAQSNMRKARIFFL